MMINFMDSITSHDFLLSKTLRVNRKSVSLTQSLILQYANGILFDINSGYMALEAAMALASNLGRD